jgi:6-pyruvoyl-tetrahydropterin synthase
MIAHSLSGEVFGPARRLHGATFVVTAEFRCEELDENGIVIDIGAAHRALAEVLEPLRYRNLDEVEAFAGKNSTTEVLAHHIHTGLAAALKGAFRGGLRVVLDESHVAWGSYEAPV